MDTMSDICYNQTIKWKRVTHMNEKLYTPLEAADILKVKKNTVYDMIKRGTLKATKMGKQLRITGEDLNQLINPKSQEAAAPVREASDGSLITGDAVIVCGQDIVLDMLCSAVNSELGNSRLIRSYDGSYNGLLSLYKDEVTVASAHIWDRFTDSYNLPYIPMLIPGEAVRVYHVLSRPIGFYTEKGNPKNIQGIDDFTREDVTIANREKGSGIRILTDSLLLEAGIALESVKGYSRIVNSHLAAAAIVAKKGADTAIGNKNVALQFPTLDFIFLKDESYDLVLKESSMKRPEIRAMIDILRCDSFREEIEAMGLYDVTGIGKRLL